MFKKIEIWILYLVVFLFFPVTIGFGFLVNYELNGGKRLGQFSKTALFLAKIPESIKKVLLMDSDLKVKDRFPL